MHPEPDPAEQGILSRIRELKAAGRTTRKIVDELNRQGAVSVCGGSTPGRIGFVGFEGTL